MFLKAFLKNFIYSGLNFFSFLRPQKSCAILMYHSVGDNKALYAVKPKDFEWQMAYLAREKYNVIALERLVELLALQKNIPDKTVILTFDDGYEDNYFNVFPVLKKYSFPAVIFLSAGFIGEERESKSQDIVLKVLNWFQIEEMHNSGLIDFEPHTVSHPKLTKISLAEAEKEIIESKKIIEERLNKICYFFSYPYGNFNSEIIKILQKNNFQAAVTVQKGFILPNDNLLELKRNFVYFYCGREEFKSLAGRGLLVL